MCRVAFSCAWLHRKSTLCVNAGRRHVCVHVLWAIHLYALYAPFYGQVCLHVERTVTAIEWFKHMFQRFGVMEPHESSVAIFSSYVVVAHTKVRTWKDLANVYTLDSCLMGTEMRNCSGQSILCFVFRNGGGSGGVRTRQNLRAGLFISHLSGHFTRQHIHTHTKEGQKK